MFYFSPKCCVYILYAHAAAVELRAGIGARLSRECLYTRSTARCVRCAESRRPLIKLPGRQAGRPYCRTLPVQPTWAAEWATTTTTSSTHATTATPPLPPPPQLPLCLPSPQPAYARCPPQSSRSVVEAMALLSTPRRIYFRSFSTKSRTASKLPPTSLPILNCHQHQFHGPQLS